MRNNNRSNVLLVEILIAVLFFMLSATVLVQVFSTSHNMTVRAGVETLALSEAQSVADALAASEDAGATLEAMQFTIAHGAWTRDYGDYTLYVEGAEQPTPAGVMWQGQVRAFSNQYTLEAALKGDSELLSLPCARYREVGK